MYFVGIDLAWSSKNSSGVAIIKGNRNKREVIYSGIISSDKEIADFINENIGNEYAFIAIDAPLIVPNKTGRRIAEVEVGKLFRKYNAGAHPANSTRLGSFNGGKVRGEEISKLLQRNGFKYSPNIKKLEESRKFFEVYPHPSMVVLFNLKSVLKYKNKPKRDYNFRWNEFKKYQNYLKKIKNPSIVIPKEISNKKLKGLKGSALKKYEDKLDAIFCAYIAYYVWFYPEKCRVLGDIKGGYILTPVFNFMK